MRIFKPGRYDREILRLAIPAFATLIAEPLYVLADTAVVGHLGTAELGGLAIASSILLLGYAVFIFLAYGTTAAVARLIGAGDETEAAHQAVQGIWLALLIGLVTGTAAWLGAPWLIQIMGGSGEVAAQALIYLRVSIFGFPALLVMLAGTGYLRGLQDTRRPLYIALGTAALNLTLELILIYGLGYGIGASALATVTAQLVGAGIYVAWIARAVRRHHVSLRPHLPTLRRLSVVGRDLFIRTAALRGSLTIGTAVAARIGTVELAAYQIGYEVWSFLAFALDAIAIAGQAMVGRMLGAEEAEESRAAAQRMNEWSVGLGVIFGVVVFALRWVLPHVFTSDPMVVEVAAYSLIWVAAMQPINGLVFSLDGILIGAGDMRFLAWAMVAAAGAFLPLALSVVVFDLGITWLWCAVVVLMATRAGVLYVRFRGPHWQVTGAPTWRYRR
ncbi:MAG: DNA damage-inducible protein F [Acidimicrobiales bacterium]|nr:MAG: MATE family efflux transporter [Actinomycetota bacterium]MBV6509302.1 DNA damage-inducible protein F [Acidimicrobiales bacterium]RIK03973.1 MAG: MATE family efflux transporter [Acidobacteriota bacterium]